jgi:2-iminobutanoate/2-iminopropanoate deaminase
MTEQREVIAGPDVPIPLGPYSPGVRAGGTLYVSGQAGIDPVSGKPAGDTLADQARQALRNVEAVLRAGGSRPELVLNVTLLVADISEFAVVNEIYAETFSVDPPARMTMQVPLPSGSTTGASSACASLGASSSAAAARFLASFFACFSKRRSRTFRSRFIFAIVVFFLVPEAML